VSRLVAVLILACGMIASLVPVAGKASAYCDAPDCVPNVARNIVEGAPCVPQPEYDFGLDANSRTFVCATSGSWLLAGPLVGLREVALPCYTMNDSAQDPNGIPLICARLNPVTLRWNNRADTPGPTRCFSPVLQCPFRTI
jgi:hypothetical protein